MPYEAHCHIAHTDRFVADLEDFDSNTIRLAAHDRHGAGTTAFVKPDAARTFARGILTLADEIDGGEAEDAPADTRPRVGDRLRVTKGYANFAPVREGQVITVHATDYDNADRTDYIRALLRDEDDYAYFISLDHVEPVTDESFPTLPAIGTRFQVRADGLNGASVQAGDVVTVSSCHTSYFGATNECGTVWYFRPQHVGAGLEPTIDDEPAGLLDEAGLADWERDLIESSTPVPAPSPFARYVDEAKRLLAGTDHTGADVVALAQELADRA